MQIISIALAITAGICFGLGVLHLFLSLRVKGEKAIYLSFALFSLAYGITALGSMARFNAQTLEQYLSLAKWSFPAFCATYILLIWFVAIYTKIYPRPFLFGMTAIFLLIAYLLPQEIGGIFFATLPWGEQITLSEAAGNTWLLFWIAVPIVSIFIIYVCIRQYWRGDRQEALALGVGFFFLTFAVIFDIFIDLGLIHFFYISDFGFLPLAVVMGFQLSNKMVVIQNELSQYQGKLERLVDERTSQLELANDQLEQDVVEREQIEKSLRQSERSARALLDAPPDTAMLATTDGEILATNQIGASRVGLTIENAVGKNIFNIFDADLSAQRKNKAQEAISKKQLVEWEDQRAGAFYRSRIYPILDEYGEVENIAIFAADISEQKQAEEDLYHRIEELRFLNMIASEITSHTEVTLALQKASQLITNLFQALSTYIIYAAVKEQDLEIVSGFDMRNGPHAAQPIHLKLDQLPYTKDVMETGKAIILADLDSLSIQTDIKNFLSENMIRNLMLAPLFIKGESIGIVVVSAGDGRAGFEQNELHVLEAIAGYIAATIENARLAYENIEAATIEERSRLARDLHDAVTQTIYAASLIVESMPQIWARNPEDGQRNLTKLRQLVRGALAEMRSLLFELRPSSLETASIDNLIQFVADAFTGRTRVPVTMKAEGIEDIPVDVKIVFYRITQEIFNNIAKHAEATSVKIDLEGSTERIALSIQDSGVGFDQGRDELTGMGLSIMRERATEIGAQLEIESQIGQGTKVTLNWTEPIQENLNE